MKYIGLDIDGVVLDYVPALMRYAAGLGIKIGCSPDGVETYCMSNAFPGLTLSEIKDLITRFSLTEEFGKINLYPGVIEVMERYKRYKNVKFVAVTNAGSSETTKMLRQENLRHLPFDEINILPLGSSKADVLREFPYGSIYVDDLKSHLDTANILGMTTILFRQSYNINDNHPYVVHDWHELDERLGELL